MILIINICKDRLHGYEFVKPIEKIVGTDFKTIHYSQISNADLQKADKIIICGTSLKDNQFLQDIEKFDWIRNCDKPILGICAGMQIISLVFGGKLKKKKEIGFYFENFEKEFLGLKGKQEVYHLHNNYVSLPREFDLEKVGQTRKNAGCLVFIRAGDQTPQRSADSVYSGGRGFRVAEGKKQQGSGRECNKDAMRKKQTSLSNKKIKNEFESFTDSEIPQAIKHKSKEIYGVLFHPEVRNKGLIENFIKL